MNIPHQIIDYLEQEVTGRIALIGCRSQNIVSPFPCCEYDIACLDPGEKNAGVVRLHDSTIELLNFASKGSDLISLYPMIPICYKNMPLFAQNSEKTNRVIENLFFGQSNKMIVNSLFNLETASRHLNFRIDLSSLYLKAASYNLIEGVLLRMGLKAMPSHELEQIRNLKCREDLIISFIEPALECLGLERASKTSIKRSSRALKEILKNGDDENIILSKIDYMLEHGLHTDCYYYLGKIGLSKIESNYSNMPELYPKLINFTFDLNLDVSLNRKMLATLTACCKKILKIRIRE